MNIEQSAFFENKKIEKRQRFAIANAVLGHCEVTVCLFVIESPNREFYKLTMKKGLICDIKIIKLFFFLSLVFFLSFCLFLRCSHVLVFKKQAHIYVDDRRGALI